MDCTSESEVCLPANYSRFQLPNKGRQTVVAIGELSHLYKRLQAEGVAVDVSVTRDYSIKLYGSINYGLIV